jgi:hypothetical protein
VRRRLLRGFVRRRLLPGDDARAMGQWAHGGAFSVDGSVRIEATDGTGASCCCATALDNSSPWTGRASTAIAASACRRERPVTGNLRGDCDRPRASLHAHLVCTENPELTPRDWG